MCTLQTTVVLYVWAENNVMQLSTVMMTVHGYPFETVKYFNKFHLFDKYHNMKSFVYLSSNQREKTDVTYNEIISIRHGDTILFTREQNYEDNRPTKNTNLYEFDKCYKKSKKNNAASFYKLICHPTASFCNHGINFGIWLHGQDSSDNTRRLYGDCPPDDGILAQVVSSIFDEIEEEDVSDLNMLRISSSVILNCCEILGDNIRDLIFSEHGMPLSFSERNQLQPSEVSMSADGKYISGLTNKVVHNSIVAIDFIQTALSEMTHLIAVKRDSKFEQEDISESEQNFEVMGPIGHILIIFDVEQVMLDLVTGTFKLNKSKVEIILFPCYETTSLPPSPNRLYGTATENDLLKMGLSPYIVNKNKKKVTQKMNAKVERSMWVAQHRQRQDDVRALLQQVAKSQSIFQNVLRRRSNEHILQKAGITPSCQEWKDAVLTLRTDSPLGTLLLGRCGGDFVLHHVTTVRAYAPHTMRTLSTMSSLRLLRSQVVPHAAVLGAVELALCIAEHSERLLTLSYRRSKNVWGVVKRPFSSPERDSEQTKLEVEQETAENARRPVLAGTATRNGDVAKRRYSASQNDGTAKAAAHLKDALMHSAYEEKLDTRLKAIVIHALDVSAEYLHRLSLPHKTSSPSSPPARTVRPQHPAEDFDRYLSSLTPHDAWYLVICDVGALFDQRLKSFQAQCNALPSLVNQITEARNKSLNRLGLLRVPAQGDGQDPEAPSALAILGSLSRGKHKVRIEHKEKVRSEEKEGLAQSLPQTDSGASEDDVDKHCDGKRKGAADTLIGDIAKAVLGSDVVNVDQQKSLAINLVGASWNVAAELRSSARPPVAATKKTDLPTNQKICEKVVPPPPATEQPVYKGRLLLPSRSQADISSIPPSLAASMRNRGMLLPTAGTLLSSNLQGPMLTNPPEVDLTLEILPSQEFRLACVQPAPTLPQRKPLNSEASDVAIDWNEDSTSVTLGASNTHPLQANHDDFHLSTGDSQSQSNINRRRLKENRSEYKPSSAASTRAVRPHSAGSSRGVLQRTILMRRKTVTDKKKKTLSSSIPQQEMDHSMKSEESMHASEIMSENERADEDAASAMNDDHSKDLSKEARQQEEKMELINTIEYELLNGTKPKEMEPREKQEQITKSKLVKTKSCTSIPASTMFPLYRQLQEPSDSSQTKTLSIKSLQPPAASVLRPRSASKLASGPDKPSAGVAAEDHIHPTALSVRPPSRQGSGTFSQHSIPSGSEDGAVVCSVSPPPPAAPPHIMLNRSSTKDFLMMSRSEDGGHSRTSAEDTLRLDSSRLPQSARSQQLRASVSTEESGQPRGADTPQSGRSGGHNTSSKHKYVLSVAVRLPQAEVASPASPAVSCVAQMSGHLSHNDSYLTFMSNKSAVAKGEVSELSSNAFKLTTKNTSAKGVHSQRKNLHIPLQSTVSFESKKKIPLQFRPRRSSSQAFGKSDSENEQLYLSQQALDNNSVHSSHLTKINRSSKSFLKHVSSNHVNIVENLIKKNPLLIKVKNNFGRYVSYSKFFPMNCLWINVTISISVFYSSSTSVCCKTNMCVEMPCKLLHATVP